MGFPGIYAEQGAIGGGGQRKRWQTGSGLPRQLVAYPFGRLTISGKAGEIKRVAASSFMPRMGVEGNIIVQASVAPVIVSITLADADLAMNPDLDDGDHWIVDVTAAPGAITELSYVSSALRLEFTADAILYIAGW